MTSLEDKSSTLRRCCDLIGKHGSLGIVALSSMIDRRECGIRKAVSCAVDLGYLKEGPKPARVGMGNRMKVYVRTKKRFPRENEAPEPEEVVEAGEFKPRRDWAVVALFGPYEARGAV